MIFKGDYYLNINHSNINEIADYLPIYNFSKDLKLLQYSHGLGDWYLYSYYIMGKTDKMVFDDGENLALRDYIVENGYSSKTIGIICICIALTLIVFCIVYIFYILIIRKNKIQKENYTKIL